MDEYGLTVIVIKPFHCDESFFWHRYQLTSTSPISCLALASGTSRISIVDGNGCSSWVGMRTSGDAQDLELNEQCLYPT